MCDVPSTAVFCSESIECFPGILLLFLLLKQNALVTFQKRQYFFLKQTFNEFPHECVNSQLYSDMNHNNKRRLYLETERRYKTPITGSQPHFLIRGHRGHTCHLHLNDLLLMWLGNANKMSFSRILT